MKNLLLYLLMTLCLAVHAQTVTISKAGCGSSSSCFVENPNTPVSYLANIANAPVGFSQFFSWEISPNSSSTTTSPLTGGSASITWANSINSPIRKLKVTVTFTKDNQPNVVKTNEVTITIKYLAPITSVTVTGGGATPGTLSSSGAQLTIPCGAKIITLTAQQSTPKIDGNTSGVTTNYTWIFPWGTQTLNNNPTITTTTNVGQTDGTITVQARRSDGTFIQSFIINITRPRVILPIVSTSDGSPTNRPICSGEGKLLTATSTNATVWSWVPSGGITTFGSTTQAATVGVVGTSNGQIKVTTDNACQAPLSVTTDLFAGVPQPQVVVDGHANNYPNATTGSSYIYVKNPSGCETYKWEVYGGSGYIYPGYGSNCGNYFNGISFTDANYGNVSTYSSMSVRIRSANRCGQGWDVIIPLQTSTGGGYYRIASANPATNTIDIEVEKKVSEKKLLKSMKLVSDTRLSTDKNYDGKDPKPQKGSNVKDNIISFDVSDLPRGLYHLIMDFEHGMKFNEKIILN